MNRISEHMKKILISSFPNTSSSIQSTWIVSWPQGILHKEKNYIYYKIQKQVEKLCNCKINWKIWNLKFEVENKIKNRAFMNWKTCKMSTKLKVEHQFVTNQKSKKYLLYIHRDQGLYGRLIRIEEKWTYSCIL